MSLSPLGLQVCFTPTTNLIRLFFFCFALLDRCVCVLVCLSVCVFIMLIFFLSSYKVPILGFFLFEWLFLNFSLRVRALFFQ